VRFASIVRLAAGLAAFIGAVLLFRYAVAVWPDSSDRHGQAVNGLDGLGTFFGLLSGAGALLLAVVGVALARPALRRTL
jgi:hypothetical protein